MRLLRRDNRGFTLIELMIVIFIIAILAAILVPNFIRSRDVARLTACKSNLKNLATSVELYSSDFLGHYPTGLDVLTPKYLKELPLCPVAARDTYSDGYIPSTNPDAFDVCCKGNIHGALDVAEDYPMWSSAAGLIENDPNP